MKPWDGNHELCVPATGAAPGEAFVGCSGRTGPASYDAPGLGWCDRPVQLSANLIEDSSRSICLLAADLTEVEVTAKSIRIFREHQQAMEESEERYSSASLA